MSGAFDSVRDSGEREQFSTGSQRDAQEGKGRFDLIPFYPMERLAQHFENGARKYDDDNWKKGQPLRQYINSASRHLLKAAEGWTDEDHPAAAVWNMMAFMWTKHEIDHGRLPAELDNIPWATPQEVLDAINPPAQPEPFVVQSTGIFIVASDGEVVGPAFEHMTWEGEGGALQAADEAAIEGYEIPQLEIGDRLDSREKFDALPVGAVIRWGERPWVSLTKTYDGRWTNGGRVLSLEGWKLFVEGYGGTYWEVENLPLEPEPLEFEHRQD